MILQGAVVAVVGADQTECVRLVSLLREAGATVSTATLHLDALTTLSAANFDAIVLDVGDDPERFAPFAVSLRGDARTRSTPLIGVVDGVLATERVTPLALARVVTSAHVRELPAVLAAYAEASRAAAAGAETIRELEERLRTALDRLAAIRADSQSLTHDARVLCGIVLGFASNLRDGVVGPLEEMQRSHVRQIVAAANDTAAILERFGDGVRSQAALPAEPTPGAHANRRATRRTLLDLSDLARTTGQAFATVAAQKRLTLVFDTEAPVSLWGDGLQLKQVIVNLLVNALKFTPAGRRVTVSTRQATPSRAPDGVSARAHAEFVVSDTGPGIPPDDRVRIFERGVRLTRDDKILGNGLGLAVAREIVGAHGGTISASETPGGGATFVVSLPVDMRSRRDQGGVLLVDDPDAARRVVAALLELRERSDEAARTSDGLLSAALEHCRAIVVVPRTASGALNDLLGQTRAREASGQ